MSGTASDAPDDPIRIGVSSCLLGQAVRYDGGHKRNDFILNTLTDGFDLIPVCPEVEADLGTPRPAVRLVGDRSAPRAVGVEDATLDVTDALVDHAIRRVESLSGLSGYIFKKSSPSCGIGRVKVYPSAGGAASRTGRGLFAAAFMARWPLVPVVEEDRLGDPLLQEHFMQRVCVLHRWQRLNARPLTAEGLTVFHARHRRILMGHSRAACNRLEGLLQHRSGPLPGAVAANYIAGVMKALSRRAGRAIPCD